MVDTETPNTPCAEGQPFTSPDKPRLPRVSCFPLDKLCDISEQPRLWRGRTLPALQVIMGAEAGDVLQA